MAYESISLVAELTAMTFAISSGLSALSRMSPSSLMFWEKDFPANNKNTKSRMFCKNFSIQLRHAHLHDVAVWPGIHLSEFFHFFDYGFVVFFLRDYLSVRWRFDHYFLFRV